MEFEMKNVILGVDICSVTWYYIKAVRKQRSKRKANLVKNSQRVNNSKT